MLEVAPLLHIHKTAHAVSAAVIAAALCSGIAFAQSSVSVTLNGSPMQLNPGPQERAGRVFVPLRGVFEQLGASVVYENGTINAQGRGHAVSLHIGSNSASVDGQPQQLDVAPFIIGASTYVPLRFVSQALGATVNYDSANRIVALSNGGQGGPPPQQAMQPPPQQPQQPQRSPLTLAKVFPSRGETVAARRPTIEADFGAAQANPNSIRVEIDGLNVTDQASRSPRGVVFSPPSDLQSGRHEVRVAGTDLNGMPFDGRWNFVSGTEVVTNSITELRPDQGANVPDQFTVRGRTMPGARVIVQVGTVNQASAENVIGQLLGVGGGNGGNSVRSEVIADGNGNFQAPVQIQARSGQPLTLVVDSTDARTRTAAPRVVRNLTAQ
jgi:Copper amine oxidase N-terminal domain